MSKEIKKEETPKPIKMTKIAARREIKKLDEGELSDCRKKILDIKTSKEEGEKAKRLCNALLDRRLELMRVRDEKR